MTELNWFHNTEIQKMLGVLAVVLSIIGYIFIALLIIQWLVP